MAEILSDVHCGLQHYYTERYSRYPANKADDAENAEYGEQYGRGVVMLSEIIDGCTNAKNDMENTSNPGLRLTFDSTYSLDEVPDELLCKSAGHGKVKP